MSKFIFYCRLCGKIVKIKAMTLNGAEQKAIYEGLGKNHKCADGKVFICSDHNEDYEGV